MSREPSATQIARAQRMKVAAEEGAKVRNEIQANDIAVRKNMDRLRALRLAREAEEINDGKSAGDAKAAAAAPARVGSKTKSAGKATKTAAKLSDWMKSQNGGGHKL